jgi:hypothetical protein
MAARGRESVHESGYGHKFEGAAVPIVAQSSEAGDRGGVVDAGIVGVAVGAVLRRECEPGIRLAAAIPRRVNGARGASMVLERR